MCPYRCQYPTYKDPPRLIKRTILELKIRCRECKRIFTIENIDAHEIVCKKPKCASPDCQILETAFTQTYTVNALIIYILGRKT